MVVQGAETAENLLKLCIGLVFQFFTKGGVGGHFPKVFLAQGGAEIEAASSAEHGGVASGKHVGAGRVEILLIAVEVVFGAGGDYIYKVKGHGGAAGGVFAQILAGAYVHAAVYLSRIGAENLSAQSPRQAHGERGFPARRGPQHCQKFCRTVALHNNRKGKNSNCFVEKTKKHYFCFIGKTILNMKKEILKSVIADNQIEIPRHQIVSRDFHFEEFGNYVFVGIRRAGKSYLLYQRIQQLLKEGIGWDEILYVNFEDERLEGMDTKDLNLLLETHIEMYGKRPTLFLDEIQNISGWEKFARRLADAKYRVYITGSNAKMLSSEIQTTLGGRYINVNVYPYGFIEYLSANQIVITPNTLYATESRAILLRYFDDFFHFGGFPEGAALKAKRDYLSSVYQKIYLGDIATRHAITNTFALRVLFKKLAESVMQPISFSRLTNIIASTGVKVGKVTVINYLEYAKDAWLLTPVQNIAGKLVEKETTPKYYFTDNGILNLFLLDAETSLLENLVAITLLRKYGRENSVFYYRKNIEVDFYIPEEETAIQVCYNLSDAETLKRETKALIGLGKVLPCKKLLVITRNEESVLTLNGMVINVVPVWKWLLQ